MSWTLASPRRRRSPACSPPEPDQIAPEDVGTPPKRTTAVLPAQRPNSGDRVLSNCGTRGCRSVITISLTLLAPTVLGVGLPGEHGLDLPVALLPRPPQSGRRTQPQRGLGRLHRMVDHHQQLGRQHVQVDLPAQPNGERLHGAGSVIALAVEARRSTRSCTRRRRGSNAAAAVNVALATARLPASPATRVTSPAARIGSPAGTQRLRARRRLRLALLRCAESG